MWSFPLPVVESSPLPQQSGFHQNFAVETSRGA
jgi:hypothetical protein